MNTLSADATAADDQRREQLELHLHRVAHQVGAPAASAAELRDRFDDVASQLRRIEFEMRAHLATRIAEERGLADHLAALEAQLEAGIAPEMRPVDEVVDELRAAFP